MILTKRIKILIILGWILDLILCITPKIISIEEISGKGVFVLKHNNFQRELKKMLK